MNLGRFEFAIRYLKKSIKDDSKNKSFKDQNNLYLGLSYFYLGNFKEALEYLEKSDSSILKNDAIEGEIFCHSVFENYDKALEITEIYKLNNPESIYHQFLYITLLFHIKKLKMARSEINILKTFLQPEDKLLMKYFSALEHKHKSEHNEAINELKHIIDKYEGYGPLEHEVLDIFTVIGTLCDVFVDFGKKEDAIKILEDAILSKKFYDIFLYNDLAFAYAELGINLDKALDLINDCLAMQPQNFNFRDTKGLILFKQKKYDLALKEFKLSLEYNPGYESSAKYVKEIEKIKGNDAELKWKESES